MSAPSKHGPPGARLTPAVRIHTEIPGPKSRALMAERRRYVSSAISEPRHGIFIERAEGRALLVDVDGNVFIDFSGGIGCVNAGHGAPLVVEHAQRQLGLLQHACFMTAPYAPYVELARKLCEIAPVHGPKKAALFNSGAEAVENAVKIARRATGRAALLAFDPGFHGRTLLALSLTSKASPYKEGFGPFAPEVYRFPVPEPHRRPPELSAASFVQRSIADLLRFLTSTVRPSSIAAVIVEPVLGEGGFIVPPPEFLLEVRRLAREHGIVFIADEVQTGFGRTGKMFACEHLDLDPDLVCLAKSIANGLPLSAVVGRAPLLDAPQKGGLGGTFGGNPVACAAALGAIETIEREGLVARAEVLGEVVARAFQRFAQRFPFIGDVRGAGAMRAIELVKDRAGMEPDAPRTERIIDLAARQGLLLLSAGLHGNVIRTLFPLSISDEELDEGLAILGRCLEESAA